VFFPQPKESGIRADGKRLGRHFVVFKVHGQMPDVRSQKSEVRRRASEVRRQGPVIKFEVKSSKFEMKEHVSGSSNKIEVAGKAVFYRRAAFYVPP